MGNGLGFYTRKPRERGGQKCVAVDRSGAQQRKTDVLEVAHVIIAPFLLSPKWTCKLREKSREFTP
jgi:hypothetical protein